MKQIESVIKIGSNSETLPVCLSKCVGLSIILKRPLNTTISFIVVGRFTRTYVTFKCGFSNQKTYQRTIWDYKRGDYTLMKQKIIDTNWEKLINDEIDVTDSNIIIGYLII
jgi:hypothetical protein